MSVLVINGSPRARGRSAAIEEILKQKLQKLGHQDISFFRICDNEVHGCVACEYCESSGDCIFTDEMSFLLQSLRSTEELIVISPIYFSGVPAQLKAVLDRLQPFFYKRQALLKSGGKLPQKKPFHLILVGEGGDPHGYQPAVTMCQSALQLADFKMQSLQVFIGGNQPSSSDEISLGKE